ncbi:MAG TPA: glycosyltransferase family 2 protein [Smithella sp.]|jgi:GT2 family glycosyltransferase|nr:glycosyltransferase family 2 protein [Smithella sp.]
MDKIQITNQFFPHVVDVVIPAYNAQATIQKPITSTLKQELPANWRQNVIITNDGSSDGTAMLCKLMFGEQVQIISHEHNRGRSASRNTGWRAGRGKYVIFLDADCEWSSTGSLCAHLKMLESSTDVSTGAIISRDPGFWGAYQTILQSSREKDFSTGNLAAFTSANFAIRRSILEASGGFDEGYRYYGFEDRDFLLRLISLGAKISFCPEAAIVHNPDSSLKEICKKMMDAGEKSSVTFQAAHPDFYARSVYGKIDCRLHGQPFIALAIISGPIMPVLISLGDSMIKRASVPFQIKRIYVKMISGLAFMIGTYRALRHHSN